MPDRVAHELNTLPDPRSPSPKVGTPRSSSPHHLDLSGEVAALSTKLVDAINHQTTLDDALQGTRHELEVAREKLAILEVAVKEHERLLANGLLVNKTSVDSLEARLKDELNEEREKRIAAENTKKTMEVEVEALTASLFEEANGMVATARQEREASERRNEQTLVKLSETENLLASHQEQLRNLKAVMQEIRAERSWTESAPSVTAPSTPVQKDSDSLVKGLDNFSPVKHMSMQRHALPENPLHYTHLIQPVMRMDIQAFEEFISLIRTNKFATAGNRSSSGTLGGSNNMNQNHRDGVQQPSGVSGPLNSSTQQNLPGAFAQSPVLDTNSHANSSPSALKDTKFYKRSLLEDVDPTLRLETAPGLSWLARRTVVSSMTSGNFIVDPFPPTYKYFSPAFCCSLCGDSRQDEAHLRRHRFRLSENEESQRYPVCDYCLGRVRATCDFLNFLRLALRGHWRNETVNDCRIAWEECIRLKERMFWTRLGAGVIPVGVPTSPQLEVPTPTPKESDAASNTDHPTSNMNGEHEGGLGLSSKTLADPHNDDAQAVAAAIDTLQKPSRLEEDVNNPESKEAEPAIAPSTNESSNGTDGQSTDVVEQSNGASNVQLPSESSTSSNKPVPENTSGDHATLASVQEPHDDPATALSNGPVIDTSEEPANSAPQGLLPTAHGKLEHNVPSPSATKTADAAGDIRRNSSSSSLGPTARTGSRTSTLVASLASRFQDTAASPVTSAGSKETGDAKKQRAITPKGTIVQIPGAFG